ncbi:Uncharacterised protein [BD1-7 clade bacterium]|uniref:Glycosyltransferase RgtA/B/C/D-like domain-containing protein n=1 Tax=BD1-7 clade bacterium TaxID=2029982 RepID=A0A5S9QA17_9GAMM|nr:Uncharacterised protein [BD1-7 clade bacterium]
MHYLRRLFSRFARWRWALPTLLLIAALLHCGTLIKGGLYADDFIHAAYFQNNPVLADKGLLAGIGAGEFSSLLANQFNFFNPDTANYSAQINFGMLPWWTDESAKLHFFRPIASLTHWLDYQLWPDNTHLMHLMNMLWYLLGLGAIYALYRTSGLAKPIVVFALLLVILDSSMFHVISWIASRSMLMVIAAGFFCLYAYHQSIHIDGRPRRIRWYLTSLGALTFALFSAEGGIAICAWLGAYLFTLDQRSWTTRIAHLLPFVVITLVWRGLYQHFGFGAFNLDFYIDPGHNPVAFLDRAVVLLPSNLFELMMGTDLMGGQIRHDIKVPFGIAGLVIAGGLLWLLKIPLKEQPALRFYALATLFSLVPGLTIVLSTRTMIIPFIGFSVLLAAVFYQWSTSVLSRAQAAGSYVVMGYTLLIHGFLATVLAIYMTLTTIDFSGDGDMERGVKSVGVDDYAEKHLVFVNSQKPFWLVFFGVEHAYRGEALPATARVLSSAFTGIEITRPAPQTLIMHAEPAFQFDAASVIDTSNEPAGHYAYLTQHLMGLLRSQHTPWHTGLARSLPEMQIFVDALHNGKPATLRIELTQPLEDYRFVYWDMDAAAYEPFVLPAVGESIKVKGIFPGPHHSPVSE